MTLSVERICNELNRNDLLLAPNIRNLRQATDCKSRQYDNPGLK